MCIKCYHGGITPLLKEHWTSSPRYTGIEGSHIMWLHRKYHVVHVFHNFWFCFVFILNPNLEEFLLWNDQEISLFPTPRSRGPWPWRKERSGLLTEDCYRAKAATKLQIREKESCFIPTLTSTMGKREELYWFIDFILMLACLFGLIFVFVETGHLKFASSIWFQMVKTSI